MYSKNVAFVRNSYSVRYLESQSGLSVVKISANALLNSAHLKNKRLYNFYEWMICNKQKMNLRARKRGVKVMIEENNICKPIMEQ